MKVLFLDAYFEPEQIAFTHLENDLIEALVDAGHKVEVVCPNPTRGVSVEKVREYRKIKKETLYNGSVHITRFSAPQEGRNPFIRALRYFWCNILTYLIGRRLDNIDAVFANSTPPTQGWIAGMVAKKLRVPFIYSLQDIFPDSLVTTGLTKQGSFLWKMGRKIEKMTYQSCSKIIVISESMKKNLQKKGVTAQKVEVISNWIDLDTIHPISKENNPLYDEFKISRDKFIVLYAGNFGAAQGAEIILEAAEVLKNDPGIQVVIFGGGAGYEAIEEKAKSLPNVFVHPLLTQEHISEVYSLGDVALVACKKGVGRSSLPSKIWSIMACNTPIIASFDLDSELARVIKESKSGICIEPENSRLLVNSILKFKESANKSMYNGRMYIYDNVGKEKCVNAYIEIILGIAHENEYRDLWLA